APPHLRREIEHRVCRAENPLSPRAPTLFARPRLQRRSIDHGHVPQQAAPPAHDDVDDLLRGLWQLHPHSPRGAGDGELLARAGGGVRRDAWRGRVFVPGENRPPISEFHRAEFLAENGVGQCGLSGPPAAGYRDPGWPREPAQVVTEYLDRTGIVAVSLQGGTQKALDRLTEPAAHHRVAIRTARPVSPCGASSSCACS